MPKLDLGTAWEAAEGSQAAKGADRIKRTRPQAHTRYYLGSGFRVGA